MNGHEEPVVGSQRSGGPRTRPVCSRGLRARVNSKRSVDRAEPRNRVNLSRAEVECPPDQQAWRHAAPPEQDVVPALGLLRQAFASLLATMP